MPISLPGVVRRARPADLRQRTGRTRRSSPASGSDPRVSFLVESGERWAELRRRAPDRNGRGSSTTRELLERVAAALDDEVRPVPHSTRPRCPTRRVPTTRPPTTTIEITPDDRILSWDNARLFAPDADMTRSARRRAAGMRRRLGATSGASRSSPPRPERSRPAATRRRRWPTSPRRRACRT